MTAPPASPRLRGLARTEVRLLRRMWVLAAAIAVTVGWSVLIQLVPPTARSVVVPLVLLMDVAALGFYFIPSLVVLERAEGIAAAMRVTPASPSERLVVRIGSMTAVSLVAALVLALAADHGPLAPVLLGATLTSVTFALLAYVMVGPHETLTEYMVRVPLVAVPLMVPALVHHLGIWDGWPLWLSPVTGQLEFMRGSVSLPLLAWQAVWLVALWWAASKAVAVDVRRTAAGGRRRAPRVRQSYTTWRAIASFARTDRATLLRDPLLLMIVAGVPLLAVVVRLVGSFGAPWIEARFGLDVAPHLPLLWGLMLVVHTPLMFGSIAGLLFLEDRDARLVPVIATTRASLRLLIAYRMVTLSAVTATMLVVGFIIAGVEHAGGWAGLAATTVAAAFLAPIPALAMAAVAPNRATGMALMKILSLPLYVPLLTWFIGMPLAGFFAPIPASWALWAMWSDASLSAWAAALFGAIVCGAIALMLGRRMATANRLT